MRNNNDIKSVRDRFIAWDGEGYTDDKGEHHYMLFGNSENQRIAGESLTYKECFELLLNAPKDANHVIYGGSYDVVMMIKTLPKEVRERLHDGERVRWKQYRLWWLKGKWLDIKSGDRSIRLYDVISFFQMSFVKACRQYLGDSDVLDRMHEMKLQRDTFTGNNDEVLAYWQSELDYLVALMNELRRLLLAVDIRPKGWFGPGAIASAVLQREGVKEHYGIVDDHIKDIAERAYYGGRFEQFKVGRITDVHEYDIRSAYPDAIRRLPSLKDCTFKSWNREDKIHPFGLYKVSWKVEVPNGRIGPLPYRSTKGQIYFPLHCEQPSWYWGIEVANLYDYKQSEWTIHEGYVPEFGNKELPFSFVTDMYNERKRMKAEGNPAERALKLGLNSLYGKLAQSKGAKYTQEGWKFPPFHNALYAGWITAATRARIYQACKQRPAAVIAVETDAVFSGVELDLPIGEDLGEWEETPISDLLYIDSGVYYLIGNDGGMQIKSRGVEVDRTLPLEYWREVFSDLPWKGKAITVSTRRFVTNLKSADYGNWRDYTRTTYLPRHSGKRVHIGKLCTICRTNELTGKTRSYYDWAHILTVPPCGSKDYESTPYAFPWRGKTVDRWIDEAIELEKWTAWSYETIEADTDNLEDGKAYGNV